MTPLVQNREFNLENAVKREKDAYEMNAHGEIKNTVVT